MKAGLQVKQPCFVWCPAHTSRHCITNSKEKWQTGNIKTQHLNPPKNPVSSQSQSISKQQPYSMMSKVKIVDWNRSRRSWNRNLRNDRQNEKGWYGTGKNHSLRNWHRKHRGNLRTRCWGATSTEDVIIQSVEIKTTEDVIIPRGRQIHEKTGHEVITTVIASPSS